MKTGCYGLFLTLLLFTGAAQAAEGEDLLRTVFADHGAIMLFVAPDTGDIVDVNQAAANFYDYPIDTLRHKQIQDINQLGPAEVAAERAKAEAENRNYFIFPHRLANGEMRTVEVYSSPIRLASGRVVLFSIVHDITGKHVAEQALLDYQNQLGELVARRTEEALAARNWIEWLLIGGLTLLAVVNALLVYHYIRRRQTFRARAGEIAERQKAQMALERAHAELQRFAEITAHHLQEPARRLGSYAQQLTDQLAGRIDDADVTLALNFISQQSRRLQNLLRDVQLYLVADQPRGPMAILDARTVLDQVLQRLQSRLQAAGAEVVIGALPPVQLDAPRLSDLWTVALDNALRHGVSSRPLRLEIAGDRIDNRIRYRISDNGPGIAPEYRERVFRVFERLVSTGAGTGIGLAIVRRISESAGGRAGIDETPGSGCTVWFELPGRDNA
ncbi:MAG: PAS domain S-box protein [Candidatus Contendobacter sp.]|jgi:chemotaxis family two-component system sensor kinase Cph1|nr:PAS domain S-box protein [Gammaproteobacteria bacterium]MCC8994855.1 PAS domain S-box protein [Candidatus Contendobacter sp.]